MNERKKNKEKTHKNEILDNTESNRKGRTITLNINGETYVFGIGDNRFNIAPCHTLAYTLRETLNLTGTKIGCDKGACGACTVLMDGTDKKSLFKHVLILTDKMLIRQDFFVFFDFSESSVDL